VILSIISNIYFIINKNVLIIIVYTFKILILRISKSWKSNFSSKFEWFDFKIALEKRISTGPTFNELEQVWQNKYRLFKAKRGNCTVSMIMDLSTPIEAYIDNCSCYLTKVKVKFILLKMKKILLLSCCVIVAKNWMIENNYSFQIFTI